MKTYWEPFIMIADYFSQNHTHRDFIRNIIDGGVCIETCTPLPVVRVLLMTPPPDWQEHIKITGEFASTISERIGLKFEAAGLIGNNPNPRNPETS